MKDTKEKVKDIRWILDVTLTFMSIELLGYQRSTHFHILLIQSFRKEMLFVAIFIFIYFRCDFLWI